MEQLFYSTGQVARQLGITLATVRLLCENSVIAAETTPGGQWRVPASEVERLERDGVPPIPRPLPIESVPLEMREMSDHDGPSASSPKPSADVVCAEDLVAITRSLLEKRRIDREVEENEDWFRERRRQQAAAESMERQGTEAKLADERRRQWIQQWTQYALTSVPARARGEVEIEVYTAVDAVFSKLQSCEPDAITRPLVDAAVHRALRPWTRKQQIERALNSAMNRLPLAVPNSSEYAPLKQRAWEAAVEAVGRLREEASDREMETTTVEAVQPMIREYEHLQACKRIVGRVYIFDATVEEQGAVKEAVRKALAALPIGAAKKELEKAEETVLKPYEQAVATRKEKKRLESEKRAQRRAVEWKADFQLDHIERYLEREYEFDGGHAERRREAERLRPLIREGLIDELLEHPDMSADQIRESIEDQIDDEY